MCNGSRMAYHLSPIAYLLILYPLPSACCSLRFTVYLYPICYILGSWPCYKVILKLIKCSFAYLLSSSHEHCARSFCSCTLHEVLFTGVNCVRQAQCVTFERVSMRRLVGLPWRTKAAARVGPLRAGSPVQQAMFRQPHS